MFKIKRTFSIIVSIFAFAIPLFTSVIPVSTFAMSVSPGDAYISAKATFAQADLDQKAATAKVSDLKIILEAKKSIAKTTKNPSDVNAAEQTKQDYDRAVSEAKSAKAKFVEAKKFMDSAQKAAKKAEDIAAFSTRVACVAATISARESALYAAGSVYVQSAQSAYQTRSNALNLLYHSAVAAKDIKDGNKTIWSAFTVSMKSATKTWKSSSQDAWKTYKTSVNTCAAPSELTDSTNMSSEVKGE